MFHEHYCSEGHQGIENWSVTLIDQAEDLDSLRKKELYWINRLNTWAPNGLMKLTTESKIFLKKLRFCIHIPMRKFLKSDRT